MGIVSIGEVVGSVQDASGQPEQRQAQEESAEEQAAMSRPSRTEDVERELRVRAWRRTRLHAD